MDLALVRCFVITNQGDNLSDGLNYPGLIIGQHDRHEDRLGTLRNTRHKKEIPKAQQTRKAATAVGETLP